MDLGSFLLGLFVGIMLGMTVLFFMCVHEIKKDASYAKGFADGTRLASGNRGQINEKSEE